MDVEAVGFWNDSVDMVNSKYFSSVFLSHAKAADLKMFWKKLCQPWILFRNFTTIAKLVYSKSTSSFVEPFLTEFQTDALLASILYEELTYVTTNIRAYCQKWCFKKVQISYECEFMTIKFDWTIEFRQGLK